MGAHRRVGDIGHALHCAQSGEDANCSSGCSPSLKRKLLWPIASNETFSGWAKTFADPRLCVAIVDQLTFSGNIIETGTDSPTHSATATKPTK